MANALAKPTFVAGPQAELAAVDVYTVNSDVVVNTVQDLLKTVNPQSLTALGGGNQNALKAKSLLEAALKKTSTADAQKNLLARLGSLSPNMSTLLRTTDSTFSSSLSGFLTSNTSGVLKEVGSLTFGTTTMRANAEALANASDLDKLFKMVTSVSTGTLGQDRNTQVNLFSGAIKQFLKFDLGEGVDAILKTLDNRVLLGSICKTIWPTVVRKSSARALKAVGQHGGYRAVYSEAPNVLKEFNQLFNLGRLPSGEEYGIIYTDILDAYESIHPGWNRYIRLTTAGAETCIKIDDLIGGSSQFNDILNHGARLASDPNEKPYLLAPWLRRQSVEEALHHHFPRVAIPLQKDSFTVVDARNLGVTTT